MPPHPEPYPKTGNRARPRDAADPATPPRTIAGDRYVIALREIRPGEEITCDYCVSGDGDTAWECSCDSPECRKHHLSGFFLLPSDVQARYLALLEDWFVAEHQGEVEALKRKEAGSDMH
jgi:hypothetical protein